MSKSFKFKPNGEKVKNYKAEKDLKKNFKNKVMREVYDDEIEK